MSEFEERMTAVAMAQDFALEFLWAQWLALTATAEERAPLIDAILEQARQMEDASMLQRERPAPRIEELKRMHLAKLLAQAKNRADAQDPSIRRN